MAFGLPKFYLLSANALSEWSMISTNYSTKPSCPPYPKRESTFDPFRS
jgi:hypothetical protein